MPLPAKASRAADLCFDVFNIEDHPETAELFVKHLRGEARGNNPNLEVDTDFEMRLTARLDGLAPAKRYRADPQKSDAILAEIETTVMASPDRREAVVTVLMDIATRTPIAEIGRLTLLVRALSDADVFHRITPGRPDETGSALPRAERPPAAAKRPRRATTAKPAAAEPEERPVAIAPDPAGFGETSGKERRGAVDFRITPLSSDRTPGWTKAAPPDPEMADRTALYAAANLAIARDGGLKLKKNAIAALKAMHEGHALYRDHREGVLRVQTLSAIVADGKVVEICMVGGSKRYDKACNEGHWDDVDPDWIADEHRHAYLTPFGLRKAIEIFGPIYTPVIVHDTEIDDCEEGEHGASVDPQARIVYPLGWAGPLLSLPAMRISELPAAPTSRLDPE